MEIIDTHTHLYLNQFDDDFDEMILRSFQCGIKKFVFPSISSKYNQKMITTLKRYPENFFLMAGLHPVYVKENFKDELKIVTNKKPSDKEFEDLLFAERVCKHVKSNAIVIAKNNKTIGIGAGQTSRVASCKIAVDNSLEFTSTKDVTGSVAASDAFFPFADGIKKLIDLGVTSIIQPGGSIRDEEVIEEANKRNVSMVFTNRRNFKH